MIFMKRTLNKTKDCGGGGSKQHNDNVIVCALANGTK